MKSIVGLLREKGWVFAYIGANQDAVEVASELKIDNAMNYTNPQKKEPLSCSAAAAKAQLRPSTESQKASAEKNSHTIISVKARLKSNIFGVPLYNTIPYNMINLIQRSRIKAGINRAFTGQFCEQFARWYTIEGERAHAMRIELPQDKIVWELDV